MLPRRFDAGVTGAILACAVVLFFVGYPLVWLFGWPSFEAGAPRFDYLVSVLTGGRTASALWNSFVASAGAMAFSVLIGVPIAFFCARTDMPLRRTVKVLVVT